jgi:2-dehydropantoate 2-reductase
MLLHRRMSTTPRPHDSGPKDPAQKVQSPPRILVIGAGVNGCIVAVRLFEARSDVTLLARPARFEALARDGVLIEDPMSGRRTVTRLPLISKLEPDDVYDYVLVVVRRNQVPELLPVLARNRSPHVVFMVNNVHGPDDWAKALGANRVLLGFVFGAGRREGNVIRAIQPKAARVPFGELDGTITPRLTRLTGFLTRAGLKSFASTQMRDWLTTHAAMVAAMAGAILKHDSDTSALARSRDDLRLIATAMQQTLGVLRATGHRVIPAGNAALGWLPRWLLVAALRRLFASRLGEVGAGWHCSQAPDEINELQAELEGLVEASGLAVPELRRSLTLGRPMPASAAA